MSQLSDADIGKTVHLAGWLHPLREVSKHLGFVKLQDSTGEAQLTIRVPDTSLPQDQPHPPQAHAHALIAQETFDLIRSTPVQSVVAVSGQLYRRPDKDVNRSMSTGQYEIQLQTFVMLNTAHAPLPFAPHLPQHLPGEATRMQHRYLDLRRPNLAHKLKLRSRVAHVIRNYLHEQGFDEVETPSLLRSTPEGAAEFLVPFRQGRIRSAHPAEPLFYALPQSPQQAKQLLIASGAVDKYYQFAKCFRDEDQRADRQPEFTQLDMEMGFVSPAPPLPLTPDGNNPVHERNRSLDPDHDEWRIGGAEVRQTIEGVMRSVWKEVKSQDPLESGLFARPGAKGLPVLTFSHAMRAYGSDKPDRRFGLKLDTFSDSLLHTPIKQKTEKKKQGDGEEKGESEVPSERRLPWAIDMLVVPSVQGLGTGKMEKTLKELRSNPSAQAVLQRLLRTPEGHPLPQTIECFKARLSEPESLLAERILSKSGFVECFARALGWEAPFGSTKADRSSLVQMVSEKLHSAFDRAQCESFRKADDPASALVFLAPRLHSGTGGSTVLGAARLAAASMLESHGRNVRSAQDDMFWVTEFPLFSRELAPDGTDVGWSSTHHPFTAPVEEQFAVLANTHLLQNDEMIASLRGQHYDLVLNGTEIGGGSVRLHKPTEQENVFRHVLRLGPEEVHRFDHLLQALRSGAPPHGGLAIGTFFSFPLLPPWCLLPLSVRALSPPPKFKPVFLGVFTDDAYTYTYTCAV